MTDTRANKEEDSSQREANENLGKESIQYARKFAKESATLFSIKNKEILNALINKINKARNREIEFSEEVSQLLMYPMIPSMEFSGKTSKSKQNL